MLKNNRPYTNENGVVDAALITDLNAKDLKTVMEWIRDNIRHADEVYPSSSYALKHMLEDDTGTYVSNNMFKDALYLAGFEPEDPDELNWHYRIYFPRDVIYNPSPFVNWLKENHLGEDTPYGDLAGDIVADRDFPIFAEHSVIAEYLEYVSTSDRILEIFEELWELYEKQATHKS